MSARRKDYEEHELVDSYSPRLSDVMEEEDDDFLDLNDMDDKHDTYYSHSFPDRQYRSFISYLVSWLPLRHAQYRKLSVYPRRRGGLSWRRRFWLALATLPTLVLLLVTFAGVFYPSYTNAPAHYKALSERVVSSQISGRGNIQNEKVYIAASVYDEDGQLALGAWGRAILDLVDILGPDNVFLSIYENDPDERAKEGMDLLRQQAQCNYSIVDEHLGHDGLPHVTLPDGQSRLKRIAFLAEVRNRALQPLDDPSSPAHAVRFDKLLFVNDVVFNPADAANLLFSTNTNDLGKAQYRAACAVDFINAFKYYDTFASRDLEGYSLGIPFYPWFSSSGQATTRKDILSQTDAVRVRSCWGGMVAFDAKYFQKAQASDIEDSTEGSALKPTASSSALVTSRPTFEYSPQHDENLNWHLATRVVGRVPQPKSTQTHSAESKIASSDAMAGSDLPLRFRAETDVFWDSSECCLIHADLQVPRGEDLTAASGIYMNPYIRVAYDERTLAWLPFTRRFERLYSPIHDILTRMVKLPGFNPRRTEEPGQRVVNRVWTHHDPDWKSSGNFSGDYTNVDRTAGPGGYCGGRKLLVMGEPGEDSPWLNTGKPPPDLGLTS